MFKLQTIFFYFLTIAISSNASVKPNFQLTGIKKTPLNPDNVQILMLFPENTSDYEIIGLMSDCSTPSTYAYFISAFKITAVKNGANCIVVKKTLKVSRKKDFVLKLLQCI